MASNLAGKAMGFIRWFITQIPFLRPSSINTTSIDTYSQRFYPSLANSKLFDVPEFAPRISSQEIKSLDRTSSDQVTFQYEKVRFVDHGCTPHIQSLPDTDSAFRLLGHHWTTCYQSRERTFAARLSTHSMNGFSYQKKNFA